VRWVDDDATFAEVVEQLAEADSIALDTEFHRERTYFPQLALLQLAWDPDQLVLVDPLAVDLRPLAEVFESDTTIVLHAASQDLEVLRLATGTVPRRVFDTQVAAGFVGFATPGLSVLHDRLLGLSLGKADRLTDWLVRPLGERALDYAADDVRYLLRIRDRLVADLTARGRLEWAAEECDEQRARSLHVRDPEQAWLRCKEARSLTGRSAAVARAIGAWREHRAAELDIPVRYVLGDLALVSIAQRPPESVAALRKVRGVDGRGINDAAAESLLLAVAEGVASEAPVVRNRREASIERELRPAVALLSSWISQYAKELDIDTALLATRHDIEEAVSGSGEGRLADGWRHDLIGRPMGQLLSGEAALAFDRRRGIVLEPRHTTS
jgi:ribonuclease D